MNQSKIIYLLILIIIIQSTSIFALITKKQIAFQNIQSSELQEFETPNVKVVGSGTPMEIPKQETFEQTTDPLVYTNDTYGFQLRFTNAWTGYKITENKQPGSMFTNTLEVRVPTSDKSWTGGSFWPITINVISKGEWSFIKSTIGESLKLLGENNNYAFVYATTKTLPTDKKTTDFEIEKVVKSFKVRN